MSSRRRLRRRGCDGKVRYRRLADALDAIVSLRGRDGVMNAYVCPIHAGGRHFHVGHAVNARRAVIPRRPDA